MFKNVGSTERYARLAAGAAAATAAARTTGWPRAALAVVAAAGLGTALTRYCPLNQAAGRDTLHGGALGVDRPTLLHASR